MVSGAFNESNFRMILTHPQDTLARPPVAKIPDVRLFLPCLPQWTFVRIF